MKQGFVIFLVFYSALLFGQAPSAESKALELNYETSRLQSNVVLDQKKYWKQVAESQANNEQAWLNYFEAARVSFVSSNSRVYSSSEKKELETIAAQVAASLPQSYCHYYIQYMLIEKHDDSWPYLLKATEIRSSPDLLDDLVCYYSILKNSSGLSQAISQLHSSGQINSELLEYNQNVLNSIEQYGVLITYGFADTYPILLLQEIYGFRKDVQIICLDWIKSNKYKVELQNRYGLSLDGLKSESEALKGCLKIESYPYVGLTLPPSLIKPYLDDLYCTGLALKYSSEPVSNINNIAFNWSLFKKKHIRASEDINVNYLVPLSLLIDYYQKRNEPIPADIQESHNYLNNRFK